MRSGLLTMAMLATALAGAAWADDDCNVPMADWQPRAGVEALAASEGWTIRRLHVDDGCYEIDGWDREGAEVEVTLDPATLEVIEIETDRKNTRGGRHRTEKYKE
ncbi:PepSY domain-containing protein [Cereibacter johrii]|uniref:PepSY domain-containing protein n=1 Tax=Cereibacter johrii TaxID=445629 RepID=UPI000DCBC68C|nr:PepSY domain-containing protein [Cereibacter johrii]QCP88080.1 PepSY domain-containing protein [Cereibacter sphaeroides]RAZ81810.1 PepSY domain-containing protein [Cereibacter johrii]RDS94853.1 PepSY domain-containing protein [Cereibacter sphaeroides f. sp. denitrificans]